MVLIIYPFLYHNAIHKKLFMQIFHFNFLLLFEARKTPLPYFEGAFFLFQFFLANIGVPKLT
ncbi:MAG: hypothetical protein EAZ95_06770 [Bacteroidetes bacterium]|nr:MAG: hypothetical protein EAZ95_06770 [Bacteroidota bacterium]